MPEVILIQLTVLMMSIWLLETCTELEDLDGTPAYLHTVTYTGGRIDTIDSPDDEHLVARNM